MEIPLKALNRLRLGREIATEAPAQSDDRLAYVLVVPVVTKDAQWTSDSQWQWAERRLSTDGSAITGYRIIRIELAANTIERIRDDDLLRSEVDLEEINVESEADISNATSRYVKDAMMFRHPDNVPDLSLVLFRLGPIQPVKAK